MSLTDLFLVVVLGIVEGVTEFLPISSTGHLIVATRLLGFPTAALGMTPEQAATFRSTFEIFIQLGAVLAVIVLYWSKIWQQIKTVTREPKVQRFWLTVLVAFLPFAIVGFLLRDNIDSILKPQVVAVTFILGGLVFLWVERTTRQTRISDVYDISVIDGLLVGMFQLLAVFPGVSRSGATIVASLLMGWQRKAATEFTFYLAIPSLGAATAFSLFNAVRKGEVAVSMLPYFGVGALVSFVVALVAIAWLLRFVSSNNFRGFGWYRIVAGIVVIILLLSGLIS